MAGTSRFKLPRLIDTGGTHRAGCESRQRAGTAGQMLVHTVTMAGVFPLLYLRKTTLAR